MEAPEAFVRTPPARSATASTPESVPLLLMVLVLARETPSPPEEAIFPALVTVHAVPVAPLTPFVPEPVDVTAPVFVTNKGLLAALRTTGPVVLVLMVLPAGGGGTLMVKVSVFEEDELGPAAAACVAVTEWLALVSGVVGVKLQLPLATVVVPTDVPSIDTVTVSLVIPDPEMVGSAVVVIVLPLSGAVMVGAAGGGGGTLMVKVSVFEEDELGPAAAACVAVTEWLALVSGVVGVKLQLPLATVVVPTDVPSIDTVTVSPVIPDPEMVGSAVVVIVLPLSGAVMVGAAGGRRHVDGEGVRVRGRRARATGRRLRRGHRMAGVGERRRRREAPAAARDRGRADGRPVDRHGHRVAGDPGPGDGRISGRGDRAATQRSRDGRRRRRRRRCRGADMYLRGDCVPPGAQPTRDRDAAAGDILVRNPESVRIVGIGNRSRIGSPTLRARGVGGLGVVTRARLIKRWRSEARRAGRHDHVIIRRKHIGTAGVKIHDHVARSVDRQRAVEDADPGADGSPGDIALRRDRRCARIGYVQLEPMDLRNTRADIFDFAEPVEKTIGVGETGNAKIVGVKRKARPLLRNCVVRR